MKAHLSLSDSDGLIAKLEIDERILAIDARKLAKQLRFAGVTADSVRLELPSGVAFKVRAYRPFSRSETHKEPPELELFELPKEK